MDNVFIPSAFTKNGFWKMLWIKIVGKREVTHNMGFKIVGYRHKDCLHITSIGKSPDVGEKSE